MRQEEKYTSEEVSLIIRLALQQRDEEKLEYSDVLEAATEFSISESELQAAIKTRKAHKRLERRYLKLKTGFTWHLYSYLFVNFGLLITNSFIPGPWWFHYSIIGWGVGLGFHYRAVNQKRPQV